MEELELALRKLSLSPRVGLERDEMAPEVRSFTVASHIAFYLLGKMELLFCSYRTRTWMSNALLISALENYRSARDNFQYVS